MELSRKKVVSSELTKKVKDNEKVRTSLYATPEIIKKMKIQAIKRGCTISAYMSYLIEKDSNE